MSSAWTTTSAPAVTLKGGAPAPFPAPAVTLKAVPPASFPASVALFVNVCCGGVPVPLVTGPARAVIVAVPALGVPAATVPVDQRTIVPELDGMTVGAPRLGFDELETYVKPGGNVSSRVVPSSAAEPVF